jgi:hypothetical protein
MLSAEVSCKFVARLQERVQEKPNESVTPTGHYPGSSEKILILEERVGKGLPLHHPLDSRVPLGQAWQIWVGANGRISDKKLVRQDRAGIIVLAPELTKTILDLVNEEFGPFCPHIIGCQPQPEPPAPKRRRAA